MQPLKDFWNRNLILLGIVLGVLCLGAAFLRQGLVATVLGLLSGTAFMMHAKPEHVEDEAEEA